ncbi:MAG: hypothetical protein KAS12_01895 [Candidatus Aenigmarchaeota archaeon]|nr:hypothetical protein [Candidatus Aenigmarchaeota archaeon]
MDIHNQYIVGKNSVHQTLNIAESSTKFDPESVVQTKPIVVKNAIYWYKKSKNDKIDLEILKTTPDAQWNWFVMSKNPYLTNEIFIEYKDKTWDWFIMSKKPYLTNEILIEYKEKSWDWNYIARNFSINLDLMKSKSDWDNYTMEIIIHESSYNN